MSEQVFVRRRRKLENCTGRQAQWCVSRSRPPSKWYLIYRWEKIFSMSEHMISEGRRRPTMLDVAAMAGVSQATVSLVLNGSPGVKLTNATRRKVLDAAKSLGYRFVRRGTRAAPEGQSTIVFIADEVT